SNALVTAAIINAEASAGAGHRLTIRSLPLRNQPAWQQPGERGPGASLGSPNTAGGALGSPVLNPMVSSPDAVRKCDRRGNPGRSPAHKGEEGLRSTTECSTAAG